MSRTRRVGAAVAALLAALVALSGCARNDNGGLAARVGDTRITTDELSVLVERALKNPAFAQRLGEPGSTDRADNAASFQRQVLGRLIGRAVLERAATKQSVTVTDAQVDERLQGYVAQAGSLQALETDAAQNGLPREEVRPFVRDEVVRDGLREKLTADAQVSRTQLATLYLRNIDRYVEVRPSHILVSNAALAGRILAAARARPREFAALAKRHSTDTSNKDKGGDLGFGPAGRFVAPFRDAVLKAQPGQTVGPVKTEFGYHIIRVGGRRVMRTVEQAAPELRAEALTAQRETRLRALLVEVTKELKVRVNPRFGRWDAATGTVVADDNQLSSPEATPGIQLPSGPPDGAPTAPPPGP